MKSRVLLGLIVIVVPVIAIFAWRHFFRIDTDSDNTPDTTLELAGDSAEESALALVHLPPDKLKSADIELSYVTKKSLRPESSVPGRLGYDDRRHVEIRSATAGVITAVHVNPGDQVRAGDVLIELNSSEVGNARADVLLRTSDLQLAIRNRDWEKEIYNGLRQLSEAIRTRKPVDNIKQQFRNVTLGKAREQLLSVYSDLLLAESLVNAARENSRNGIMPGRILEERINSRDNSEATLQSALEEMAFAVNQDYQRAENQVADAERRLKISQQAVQTLLGQDSVSESMDMPAQSDAVIDPGSVQTSLSLVRLRAPFDGTIERRAFSPSERVAAGESMLTLADTSTLWASANLREREWNALALKTGDEIRVETSVTGMETLTAKVHFVGREVDPASNAIPLVATIDNAGGKLRPGMFIRVAVPLAEAREALTIPESSILEHDRETFVFGPDGESTFRRINIIPGIRVGGLVEVISGLNPGEPVVSGGGFYLKSEMLLEGEE